MDISRYIVHHKVTYRENRFVICPWHYQLAMLLDFWLYQTGEDATFNHPLRLAMEEFRNILYRFIVRNNPQYTALRWGDFQSKEAPCNVTSETNDDPMKPDPGVFDQVGGYHEGGTGTDPNGNFCGECSYTDCFQCSIWR